MNLNSHTAKAIRRVWRTAQRLAAAFALGALTLVTGAAFAQSADLGISAPTLGTVVSNANGSWTIPVTYTVTNNGTVATSAAWYDLAYLSTDATLDNSDTYTGSLGYRSAALAAGASYTTTVNVTTATTVVPGTYTLILKADGRSPSFNVGTNTDNGLIAEASETNNVSATNITLTRPDISVGAPTLGTPVSNANGSWTIPVTYTVTNNGSVAAPAGWYDLAYLSTDATLDTGDTFLGSLGNRGTTLAAGASYTTTVNVTTATTVVPGTYTLILKTDGRSPSYNGGTNTDNGAIAEADETNNVSSTSITLSRPDLGISAPTLGTVVSNTNGSWTVPVTYTVTNNGSVAAPAGWYDLAYLSSDAVLDTGDTFFGSLGYRSATLAAGASYTTTVNVTTATTLVPGTYTLILKADGRSPAYNGGTNTDNGAIAEANETNNVSSVSLTLTRPDLSISAPTFGTVVSNANGSWTVPVTYTVTNNGTVAAPASWYDHAYLSADAVLDNNDYAGLVNSRSTALAAGASYTVTANFTTTITLSSGTYTLFVKADGRSPSYGGTNTDNGAITEGNEANNVQSASVTLANKAITATTLSSSVNPANLLQSTQLTATVLGNGIPTGSVTFKDGNTALATVSLNAGTASYAASFTTSGTHSLTAVYSGTSGNPASTSPALSQTVSTVTATSTALSAAPNPVVAGQIATITATITGNSPGGTVTIKDGTSTLGTAPVSGNKAIYAATFASAGDHSLSASYSGDSFNTASVSAAVSITVNATPAGQLPAVPASPTPVVNYEYDAQGNPTKTIQAPGISGFGFESKASYDALYRVKDTTDPKLGKTQMQYDGGDRTTQVTDPRNLVTQYPRDGLGQATQLISPDTGTASHTYDAAGNLKTRTDSRGVLATNTYDELNRLTNTVYSKSGLTSQTYGWAYDQTGAGFANGVGRLTSTMHPSGSTQYSYDPQGRLLTDTQVISAAAGANGSPVTSTVSYGYDAGGHVTSITYPSGRQLVVTYTDGQPSAMSLAKDSSSTPVNLITGLAFEPFGGVSTWQWQLNTGTQGNDKVYDTSGRLVRYRLGNIIRDLSYDAADRITAYTHYDATSAAPQTSLDQGFGYDANGQLTSITTATASLTIAYDANGNRTGVTLNGTPSTYTTETTSNRLSSTTSPARSFGYDSAGNTTSDTGGYTATYDASGRLATLTKAGTTTTYSYNGLGQRVRKFSSSGAGSTTLFVYDQNGQLLGEYDQSGSAVREYVWFGSTPIAVLLPNGGNDPLAYYFHTDHLNTPRLVTDTANNIRWRWLAEPFGTTAPEDNPSSLGAFTQNLRFPGQYADQESGLSYNYFRNYDASIGRYNTSDPIGLEGGVNTFAYVKGNTLSYSDPQGLNAVAVLPGVGALCAASAGTGCAAAAVGAVGVGAYWLTDTYVNPWAQPLITKAIDACTVDWDQIQKDTDHANYHRTCDRKPPSNLTPCELARWNRRQAQSCFDKRSEWEERWGDSSTKAAHRRALENVKRRLSNAVQDIITFCPASL